MVLWWVATVSAVKQRVFTAHAQNTSHQTRASDGVALCRVAVTVARQTLAHVGTARLSTEARRARLTGSARVADWACALLHQHGATQVHVL